MGQNITHIFFEENTKIRDFLSCCFFAKNIGMSKLKFVEFPDTLETISQSAFYCCDALNYNMSESERALVKIDGSSVKTIREFAFAQAFARTNIKTFTIKSSVESIFEEAFRNTGLTISELYIGSNDARSSLTLHPGSNPIFNNKSGELMKVYAYMTNGKTLDSNCFGNAEISVL
jgi:hypothetical protein